MNFRQTAILLGAVLAVGVVLLILTWTSDDRKTESSTLCEEFDRAATKDIDTVEIERDGKQLKMVRTDANKKPATWMIVEPFKAPADTGAVEGVINALMSAKVVSHPELSGNPAIHGLDPAELKITIAKGTDKSCTVNLGNVTIGGKGVVFVTTSKRTRPMAVSRSDLDALFREQKGGVKASETAKWVNDFRLRTIFPSAVGAPMGEDIASIKFSLPNKKKELALSRPPGGTWKFDSPAGWGEADADGDPVGLPNTFTGVNSLVRAITALSANSAADFVDLDDAKKKEFGLNPDNPDLVRVELKTRDGQTATVLIGRTEGAPTTPPPPKIPGMPPPTGGKVFISIEGQPGAIKASTRDLSGLIPIIEDPNPLRDRNLLTLDRGKQIDGLDILLAGQAPDKPTKLRRVGLDWKLYGGPNDPQNANASTVGKIIDVLTARRSIKDFPASNPADFAAISETIYVWVDGFGPAPLDPKADPKVEPKAEPVKKGEPVKLEFGRRDGESIYVRRTLPGPNGAVSVFTMPTAVKVGGGTETLDLLATISKSRLDLLDRSLPPFGDTTQIAVAGAANYVVARDEKPDPITKELLWRFAKPDARAPRVVDGKAIRDDIIYYLANASSQIGRFVDEAPTPEKLAEYGFTPTPRLKATIALPSDPKAPKNIVFEFGKDATDPDHVYARVEGRAAVFTLGRVVLDKLVNVDLRDRAVFRDVPAAQVNMLEVTGWGGITLKFEKNAAGVWESKPPTPPAFMVDPAKVNAFLTQLTQARVKTFEKGEPEQKHGFGDPKVSLQVTLAWPGGRTSLNIAASPDGGASYFCWSEDLHKLDKNNPICTLDSTPFKPYKDGSGSFAK
jgi:hypothetical protein